MADRPIIFSAPMVRALLDGRKTQTRRVLKPQPFMRDGYDSIFVGSPFGPLAYAGMLESGTGCVCSPRYAPGDRLWVREAWSAGRGLDDLSPATIAERCVDAGYRHPWAPILYEADGSWINCERGEEGGKLRPSIHMPRWASRLTLLVTDVRVQRLQDISEADAVAEGCAWSDVLKGFTACPQLGDNRFFSRRSARSSFEQLWGAVHDPATWNTNPWVAAVTFTVERRNIDASETGGER